MVIRNDSNHEQDNNSLSSKHFFNNKLFVACFLILLFVGIIATFVYLMPKYSAVGQAVHVVTQTTAPGTVVKGNGVVWITNAKVNAAPGDIVTVPILFKTNGDAVTSAEFKVTYDPAKLTTVGSNVPVEGVGFQWLGLPAEIANDIEGGKAVGLMSPNGVAGNSLPLATLYFKVKGGYDAVESPITLNVSFSAFGGVDASNVAYTINLSSQSIISQVVIVPNCSDSDGDGYGKQATDLRGCIQEGNKLGTVNVDCNDTNNTMFPGNTEVCDGKDNNCNGVVDDNPVGGGLNSETRGVCYGNKVCYTNVTTKVTTWKDSYLVSDSIITFNGVQQSTLYEGVIEKTCDIYDNNCNGQVNEGLLNCVVGGGTTPIPVGLLPTGNTVLEYGVDNKLGVQKIDSFDISLLYLLKSVRNDTTIGGGGQGLFFSKIKGTLTWVCDDGTYYIKIGNNIEKFSYKNDVKLPPLVGVSVDGSNQLMNGSVTIKC